VSFELAVMNADKPPLSEAEIWRRVEQFRGRARLVLTRAPRFIEKARLFPGCVFVLGYDTAVRLVQPRFYGDSEAEMRAALDEMLGLRCRFLVAGRGDADGYHTLDEVALPPEFASMFEAIPESQFRVDLSSTELREKR
jgi:hypothetical protein